MFEKIWTIANALITLTVTILSVWLWVKKKRLERLREEDATDDIKTELERTEQCVKNLEGVIDLLQGLPAKISEVEEIIGDGNGSAKKHLVVSDAYSECLLKGVELSKDAISEAVENILDTPQKKNNKETE